MKKVSIKLTASLHKYVNEVSLGDTIYGVEENISNAIQTITFFEDFDEAQDYASTLDEGSFKLNKFSVKKPCKIVFNDSLQYEDAKCIKNKCIVEASIKDSITAATNPPMYDLKDAYNIIRKRIKELGFAFDEINNLVDDKDHNLVVEFTPSPKNELDVHLNNINNKIYPEVIKILRKRGFSIKGKDERVRGSSAMVRIGV